MNLSFVKKVYAAMAMAAVAFAQTPDFIQPASYATGGSSKYAAVGDFNGDGRPDIATYEPASQTLSVLFGDGKGSFLPAVSHALGFSAASIAAADLNGDGCADLVFATTGGVVAVVLSSAAGSFAPPAYHSAGISANYVTAADLNHDGVLDLIVAGGNGYSVLRGVKAGTFSAPLILAGTFSHFWVGVADFNGDGNLDLVSDGSPGQFYAGNGDGTFAAPAASNVVIPYGGVTGDFNGDGKMDIAYLVTTFNQERVSGQQVSVLIGTGTGQFLDAVDMFFPGGGTGQVAAGDFNGDNRTDLAIWLGSSSRLYLMPNGTSSLVAVPGDLTGAANASLTAADTDGNGSKDLLLLNSAAVTLLRNSHGNPPLLAVAAVAPASVTGGLAVQGSVALGGPAPAGGATIALSSSNPSLAHPVVSTVTIPAGASTGTFSLSTAGVLASTPVDITATYNSVAQTAVVTLVAPYSLTGVTVAPARQFGGFTTNGTIVLSGPADSNATVQLTSSNTAIASVPASVTVPAGATSATFPIALQPVPADTVVSISAAMGGVTRTAAVTVLRALDSVSITKAEYAVRSFQLKVEAASTSTAASLSVWNAATGALIGNLTSAGGGKYTGTFTISPAVLSVSVKSTLGGIATGAVAQK